MYTWDFKDVKFGVAAQLAGSLGMAAKFRSLYDIGESNRFRHPDYNPDQAQKLISSSMSRHLSTLNISSKSMHAFLSNLANKQTEKHLPPPLSEVNDQTVAALPNSQCK